TEGGLTNGQPDPKSSTITVSFTIDAINDAPIFLKGADAAADDEDPATHGPALQTIVAGWATGMVAGPATATDETGQQLGFTITLDPADEALFAARPAVDAVTGDLTFTVAPNAHGTVHVSVALADNGGTDGGGI